MPNDYLIKGQSLDNIANSIHTINGESIAYSPATMKTKLDNINDEVVDQTSLISQIEAALEGKTGGSGVSVEPLSVIENGLYTAPSGTAYNPITVNVSGGGPTNYITFIAQQTNSSVKIEIKGTLSPITLFYSTDNTTWQPYTINTVITLTNIGDYVSFYGEGNWRATYSTSNYLHFVMTGKIAGSGDCNALLETSSDGTVGYCYYNLFDGCTSLTEAPELPATTLATYCYRNMFNGCTSLTQAPALPATTLKSSCYQNMFEGCTSLAQAPELPATTLATYCYYSMFEGCTSLAQAPELPATTLAQYCYQNMFQGCTSLEQSPTLLATTLKGSCYRQMFYNCTALKIVKTAAISWNTSYASNWLSGVAASGTVYCPSNSTIPTSNVSGIPTGWSRVDWTPTA